MYNNNNNNNRDYYIFIKWFDDPYYIIFKAIAGVISEMPSKNEFCDLPVEKCFDWLKLNCEIGYIQVEDFIKKYGHRGIQEVWLISTINYDIYI